MAIAENITPNFCRINTLLDLMEQDIKKHNNSDFDVLEALLPAVQGEIYSLRKVIAPADDGTPIRLVADGAVDVGLVNSRDDHLIDGATATTAAIRQIPQVVASDGTGDEDAYWARREAAIASLLAAAGPMPPKAVGAFRVLAEFIVGGEQDSTIYALECWVPEAAMSQEERAEYRDRIFALGAE